MTGAYPDTEWLRDSLALDAKGFIMIGAGSALSCSDPDAPDPCCRFEKNAVELFDVVFHDRYGLETLENHVHCIGVADL